MNLAATLRRMRAEAHALSAERDRMIAARRKQGWGTPRIGAELGISAVAVRNRIIAMGLPTRLQRRLVETMTPEQVATYRLLISKRYNAAEARAMLGIK